MNEFYINLPICKDGGFVSTTTKPMSEERYNTICDRLCIVWLWGCFALFLANTTGDISWYSFGLAVLTIIVGGFALVMGVLLTLGLIGVLVVFPLRNLYLWLAGRDNEIKWY